MARDKGKLEFLVHNAKYASKSPYSLLLRSSESIVSLSYSNGYSKITFTPHGGFLLDNIPQFVDNR